MLWSVAQIARGRPSSNLGGSSLKGTAAAERTLLYRARDRGFRPIRFARTPKRAHTAHHGGGSNPGAQGASPATRTTPRSPASGAAAFVVATVAIASWLYFLPGWIE